MKNKLLLAIVSLLLLSSCVTVRKPRPIHQPKVIIVKPHNHHWWHTHKKRH